MTGARVAWNSYFAYATGIPMERYTGGRIAWSELAPVLLRGRLDADLTRAEN